MRRLKFGYSLVALTSTKLPLDAVCYPVHGEDSPILPLLTFNSFLHPFHGTIEEPGREPFGMNVLLVRKGQICRLSQSGSNLLELHHAIRLIWNAAGALA